MISITVCADEEDGVDARSPETASAAVPSPVSPDWRAPVWNISTMVSVLTCVKSSLLFVLY